MKIERMLISKLIPYAFNNKIHTQEQIHNIANSIKRFGFLVPIVVDEDNMILSGHGRYYAAQLLNLDEVPVHQVSGLTETEKRAYRIVDNKVAADTSYDMRNIEIEIQSLAEAGFQIEEFNFDDFQFEPPEEELEEQKKEEPEGKWIGQIKLKVSADEIDSFEEDLDSLIKKFNSVTKETKRAR